MERDGLLGAMAAGLKPKVIEPQTVRCSRLDGIIGVANAVGVHRAMKIHAGNTVAMRLQDTLDPGGIGNVCRAFIMDDEVVTFGVIGISEDGQRRLRAGVVRVNLVDDDIRAFLNALLKDILLLAVFVAATSCNEQDAKRFRRGQQAQWRRKAENDQREERQGKGVNQTAICHRSVLHALVTQGKSERRFSERSCIRD